MGAVAVEPVAVRRAGAVPVDNLHVAVTVSCAFKRGVRFGHPSLRAARVHEEHVLIGAHFAQQIVKLFIGYLAVCAQREHDNIADDALFGIGAGTRLHPR